MITEYRIDGIPPRRQKKEGRHPDSWSCIIAFPYSSDMSRKKGLDYNLVRLS
jgi:hypothetical protein